MRLNTTRTHISHTDRRPQANGGPVRDADVRSNSATRQTSRSPLYNNLYNQQQTSGLNSPEDTSAYESPTVEHVVANQVHNGNADDDQNSFIWEQEEEIFDFFPWIEEDSFAHLNTLSAENSAAAGKQESPEDISGSLTRRLVSANNTFIIHRIIGDAFTSLGELRLALAMSDGEDADAKRQIIRRLERVIRRGNRKIRDLNYEGRLQQKQERAERNNKLQRAREIEAELRQQIINRRNRERGYLDELIREEMAAAKASGMDILDAAAKAKIAALAMAIATMEASAGFSGGSGGFEMPGVISSGAAAFEGGSAGAEGMTSGELDVSV